MRGGKSFFGVGGALLPVVYCAGLVYYFVDFSGSVQEAEAIGLGPTVLGLGAVGLLTSIPLIMKVTRLVGRSRARKPDDDEPDDTFDADAAIARFKSRQAEAAPPPPAHKPPQPKPGGTSRRPTFGRR